MHGPAAVVDWFGVNSQDREVGSQPKLPACGSARQDLTAAGMASAIRARKRVKLLVEHIAMRASAHDLQ